LAGVEDDTLAEVAVVVVAKKYLSDREMARVRHSAAATDLHLVKVMGSATNTLL
jgi:hypothetical protein